MAADDDLFYNYGGIAGVTHQINTFCTTMESDLAELKTQFDQLIRDGWEGKAADEFTSVSNSWRQQAEDIRSTFVNLAKAVEQAADAMNNTDNSIANAGY
jgi:WXG100 family type VII secretion target